MVKNGTFCAKDGVYTLVVKKASVLDVNPVVSRKRKVLWKRYISYHIMGLRGSGIMKHES